MCYRLLINFISILALIIIQPHYISSQRHDIGLPVNEENAIESTPSISLDGNTLIYVSNKTGIQNYYQSFRNNDGTWGNPIPIDSINMFCKTGNRLGASSLSFDGNTLYFCADIEGGFGDMDIYISKRKGKEWGRPINLGGVINSELYEGTPSISVDEKTLYFATDNPGFKTKGFFCKKISIARKNLEGNWQKALPLPPPVNLDCEQSPRICFDNRTLFFSSVREGGIGKADLYMTKILAKNIYSEAIPMDFTNTDQGDMYASVLASGEMLYYSISAKEYSQSKSIGGVFIVDIPEKFQPFKSVTIYGEVKDSITGNPLEADIIITNANTTLEEFRIKSNEVDGKYTIVLAEGKNYAIEFAAKNYSHKFMSYKLKKLEKNRTEVRDVGLFKDINLEVNIYDKDLFEPINANIYVVDNSGVKLKEAEQRKISKGVVNLKLPVGKKYNIEVSNDNYSTESFYFDLDQTIQFNRFVKNIELKPERQEHNFDLSNLGIDVGETIEMVSINQNKNEKIVTKITKQKNGYKIEVDGKTKEVEKIYPENYIKGDRYNVTISPNGYMFYSTSVDLKKGGGTTKLKLTKIEVNTKITLDNIVFESNSAELDLVSFIELNKVVKLLRKNKNVKIEISAHTDDVGSNKYNLILSNRRAESVVNYLIEKEIEGSRLQSKGYGETEPEVPNNSDENRAINRRVELKIIGV